MSKYIRVQNGSSSKCGFTYQVALVCSEGSAFIFAGERPRKPDPSRGECSQSSILPHGLFPILVVGDERDAHLQFLTGPADGEYPFTRVVPTASRFYEHAYDLLNDTLRCGEFISVKAARTLPGVAARAVLRVRAGNCVGEIAQSCPMLGCSCCGILSPRRETRTVIDHRTGGGKSRSLLSSGAFVRVIPPGDGQQNRALRGLDASWATISSCDRCVDPQLDFELCSTCVSFGVNGEWLEIQRMISHGARALDRGTWFGDLVESFDLDSLPEVILREPFIFGADDWLPFAIPWFNAAAERYPLRSRLLTDQYSFPSLIHTWGGGRGTGAGSLSASKRRAATEAGNDQRADSDSFIQIDALHRYCEWMLDLEPSWMLKLPVRRIRRRSTDKIEDDLWNALKDCIRSVHMEDVASLTQLAARVQLFNQAVAKELAITEEIFQWCSRVDVIRDWLWLAGLWEMRPTERAAANTRLEGIGGIAKGFYLAADAVAPLLEEGNMLPLATAESTSSPIDVLFALSVKVATTLNVEVDSLDLRTLRACLVRTRTSIGIVLNRRLPASERSFAVCHELSHLLLHHEPNTSYALDLRQLEGLHCIRKFEVQEQEADTLAEVLLHLLRFVSDEFHSFERPRRSSSELELA